MSDLGKFDDLPEERRRGLEKMEQVYGFEMSDGAGDFFRYTADHLFADIWSRPGLSDRDRRLLLIGMLAGTGAHDVLTIQVPAALSSGDLDAEALREIVVFLSHYAGWPNGARLNSLVEDTIAKASRELVTSFEALPPGQSGLISARPGPDLAAAGLRRAASTSPAGPPCRTPATRRPEFATRVAVRRPASPGSFSGTVVVEWLNVSSGSDAAPDWTYLADEIVRRGHAWVGVSAQHVGVEGGEAVVAMAGVVPAGIKARQRYAALHHPGDAYSLLDLRLGRRGPGRPAPGPRRGRAAGGGGVAVGVRAHHVRQPRAPRDAGLRRLPGPLARRRGDAARRAGSGRGPAAVPRGRGRADPRRPRRAGGDRPDRDRPVRLARLRARPAARLGAPPAVGGGRHRARRQVRRSASSRSCSAARGRSTAASRCTSCARRCAGSTSGSRGGDPAPRAERIRTVRNDLVRDEVGNAEGGVRTPCVEAPVEVYRGDTDAGAPYLCQLFGSTLPMDPELLRRLWPDRATYLAAYERATDAAIAAGFVLPEDRAELLAEARPGPRALSCPGWQWSGQVMSRGPDLWDDLRRHGCAPEAFLHLLLDPDPASRRVPHEAADQRAGRVVLHPHRRLPRRHARAVLGARRVDRGLRERQGRPRRSGASSASSSTRSTGPSPP